MSVLDRIRGFFSPTVTSGSFDVDFRSDSPSVQPRFHTDEDIFYFLSSAATANDGLPQYGSDVRDEALRTFWKSETILAGAVSSMTQKLVSLAWTVIGSRRSVIRAANLCYGAEDGKGWGYLIGKLGQDYLTQDKGMIIEKGFRSRTRRGPVAGLFHLDVGRCRLTTDRDYPIEYSPEFGDTSPKMMPRDSIIHLVSLPSPEEKYLGRGFCAVSRAAKAANILLSLYRLDQEKLSDMPPKGFLAISGMSGTQVKDAAAAYRMGREQREQLVFPGVIWLASPTQIGVDLVPFATLPDQFDREVIVTLYVYTLALAFGVDAREFWPATVTGATKADALIQAQKAKGKGPGELISSLERAMNFEVMPRRAIFRFDFLDDEEDLLRAEIAKIRSETLIGLYNAGVVNYDEARDLAVMERLLPTTMVPSDYTRLTDIEGHRSVDELAVVRYDNGVLSDPVPVRVRRTTQEITRRQLERLSRPDEYSTPVLGDFDLRLDHTMIHQCWDAYTQGGRTRYSKGQLLRLHSQVAAELGRRNIQHDTALRGGSVSTDVFVEVDEEQAASLGRGCEFLVTPAALDVGNEGLISIIHDGKLHARVAPLESARVNSHNVYVVKAFETFDPPIAVEVGVR